MSGKLVRITCHAFLRYEWSEVVRVPDNISAEEAREQVEAVIDTPEMEIDGSYYDGGATADKITSEEAKTCSPIELDDILTGTCFPKGR